MNCTYIVQCSGGTYYTGWTNDLEKRLKAHNSGKGGKYTHARFPVKLVYFEEYATKQEAQSREFAIKRLSRQEKERLIADNDSFSGLAGAMQRADIKTKEQLFDLLEMVKYKKELK